jgi:hypothetical protein
MIGDKQGSETKTFEAVADTVDELAKLTGFIINSLNGSAILITADHGFVYQESAMEEADRSSLDDKPSGAIKAKKRYLLGTTIGENAKAWSGNTSQTAGTDPGQGSLDFWVPKGVSRFHFAGGARFVHEAPCRRRSWSRLSRFARARQTQRRRERWKSASWVEPKGRFT